MSLIFKLVFCILNDQTISLRPFMHAFNNRAYPSLSLALKSIPFCKMRLFERFLYGFLIDNR